MFRCGHTQSVNTEEFTSSSKVDALVRNIRAILPPSHPAYEALPDKKGDKVKPKAKRKGSASASAKATAGGANVDQGHKAIVFSQYSGMIDLVEFSLKRRGIKVVKLIGSMPVPQRTAVLKAFKSDPSVSVIILSLRAGGEGLNLQEASYVFVIEPWWNPAVEWQAIQRAHRIGQKRKVRAVRFVTKNTIEEKMFELQEKKQLIFKGIIDSSAVALSQLTEEDMKFLFGGS